MPVYDLAAYLTAADQATGWSSDMMAARELDRLRLAEYQAIVDLCAAFQPAGFDGGSHYQRVDPSDARLTAVLADNAADPQPSYARLLSRLIESGGRAAREPDGLRSPPPALLPALLLAPPLAPGFLEHADVLQHGLVRNRLPQARNHHVLPARAAPRRRCR